MRRGRGAEEARKEEGEEGVYYNYSLPTPKSTSLDHTTRRPVVTAASGVICGFYFLPSPSGWHFIALLPFVFALLMEMEIVKWKFRNPHVNTRDLAERELTFCGERVVISQQ